MKPNPQQALANVLASDSHTNYAAIYNGFGARGISQSDIRPRENVFTYNAWKALGRQVRKGEHGVKVVTMVDATRVREDKTVEKFKRPLTTTVFHVSQTEPVKETNS